MGCVLTVPVASLQIARGVDMARVNLVASLDLPRDGATYMHRVGRTGRYGTRGVAITFLTSAELARLQEQLQDVPGAQARQQNPYALCPALKVQLSSQMEELPDEVPEELYTAELDTPEEEAAFQELLGKDPAQQVGHTGAIQYDGSHQQASHTDTTGVLLIPAARLKD